MVQWGQGASLGHTLELGGGWSQEEGGAFRNWTQPPLVWGAGRKEDRAWPRRGAAPMLRRSSQAARLLGGGSRVHPVLVATALPRCPASASPSQALSTEAAGPRSAQAGGHRPGRGAHGRRHPQHHPLRMVLAAGPLQVQSGLRRGAGACVWPDRCVLQQLVGGGQRSLGAGVQAVPAVAWAWGGGEAARVHQALPRDSCPRSGVVLLTALTPQPTSL